MPAWLSSAIIYQVFTGRWDAQIDGNQILRRATFNDLSHRHWQRLRDLGINTIYLLGVWDNRGPIIVQEEEGRQLPPDQFPRVPSIFAITDHAQPHLGTLQDLKNLIGYLHQQDFQVILDFVPNHTSTIHPWVTSHPEYYHQANPNNLTMQQFNNLIKEFSGDVYKLNYDNHDLRQAMIAILQQLADLNIDGLRCDMAHLVPTDFWQTAITALKADHPDLAFIAEAYTSLPFDNSPLHHLLAAGFDAVYNKSLYDSLNQIIVDHQPLSWLAANLNAIKTNFPSLNPKSSILNPNLNFFSNHDDPPLNNRSLETSKRRNVETYLESLLALLLFTPGLPLIYNGSLLGFDHRLAHHWFESLPINFLETENSLPENLQKLFHLRQQLHPHGISSEHFQANEQSGLLILSNHDYQAHPYQLFLNLTDHSFPLPFNFPSSRLHPHQSSELLYPGQIEILTDTKSNT